LTKAGAWAPDLEIARTQIAQAEAAVHQDEVNIERLTTRAPIDGRILQNKGRLGQFAQCGPLAEPLMIFGGKGAMHLRVDVDVRFHSGKIYRYFDFPPDLYEELLAADSKGTYFAEKGSLLHWLKLAR
jgi:hypothetical protein